VPSKGKVAIIDDSTELCRLYSLALKTHGYEVPSVIHLASQAIEMSGSGRFSGIELALVDYRMGSDLNGLDVARELRKKEPGLKVIIVTAEYSIEKKVVSEGFPLLKKPFSIRDLFASIEEELV
jgi:two-component system, NtrC family, sensor kinase